MNDKVIETSASPNFTPALQVVDYWTELAMIACSAWFNNAMIVAAGASEDE